MESESWNRSLFSYSWRSRSLFSLFSVEVGVGAGVYLVIFSGVGVYNFQTPGVGVYLVIFSGVGVYNFQTRGVGAGVYFILPTPQPCFHHIIQSAVLLSRRKNQLKKYPLTI